MTIEEHFLLMLALEFGIFLLGILWVVRNQQKQTKLIESVIYNPDYAAEVGKNLLFGVMEDITEDEKKQDIFFGFVQTCSVNAVLGVQNYFDKGKGTPADPQALKGLPKPVKTLVRVADMVGINLKSIFKQKAAEKVDTIVEGWG